MIKKEDARAIIIHEWLQVPESNRTDADAALFAFKMANRPDILFRTSADRYQVVKGWLNRFVQRV